MKENLFETHKITLVMTLIVIHCYPTFPLIYAID